MPSRGFGQRNLKKGFRRDQFSAEVNARTLVSLFTKKVSCRNAQEVKDVAYCFASKQIEKIEKELPLAYEEPSPYTAKNRDNTIFYVETQKKTGTMNDYGQFLFAKLPRDGNNYKEMTVSDPAIIRSFKPYLFTFFFEIISVFAWVLT